MKKINFKKFLAFALTGVAVLSLAACSNNSNSANKENLPSAKKVLTGAQNTKLNSMTANWLQTNAAGKETQKATAQYQKKPVVIHADFSTEGSHYKMWIDGKYNYIQSKGTATNKWFKTKISSSSSYAQLTADLAQSAILSLSSSSANLFKVSKTNNGYLLSYSGNNKKIWKSIIQDSMITSVIGIDPNNVEPDKTTIKINTDSKYNLTKVDIDAGYKDDGTSKHLKLNIDDINKSSKLKVPDSVIKSAVKLSN